MKKRVDVELDLEILAWYASEATKRNTSRRQWMTSVLYNVYSTMQQSPDMPIRYGIEFTNILKHPLTPDECIETKPESDE